MTGFFWYVVDGGCEDCVGGDTILIRNTTGKIA